MQVDVPNPAGCCETITIAGIQPEVKFYGHLMGDYTLYHGLPYITYEKVGKDVDGKYPVYQRILPNGAPAYVYYYVNEEPNFKEKKCPKTGCWVLSKERHIYSSNIKL